VATNPNTSWDILRDLAKDEHFGVRYDVTQHPNTPKDILVKLATDSDWWVRESTAINIKTSTNTLVMLFEYEKNLKKTNKYVIQALYRNEKLPLAAKRVIETLYEEWTKWI